MESKQSQLAQVRAAKVKARKLFRQYGTIAGIGITRLGGQYCLKVNLKEPPTSKRSLPRKIDGVPVVVQVVGTIRKQPSARARRVSSSADS